MITPKESDRVFYDSPDAGHPTCLCSRCGNQIKDEECPIRMWPTEPGDIGFDPKAKGGTEFRYCQKCCEAEGVHFAENYDYPDPNDDFPEGIQYTECIKCGRNHSHPDVSGISEDGFCTICVARMQDDGLSPTELLNQED